MIEQFSMDYIQDYFEGFDEEITKYQWPDPFESVDDARELLQEFFYEADIRNIGSMKLLRKFEDEYEIIEQELEKVTTDSGKELELQGYIMKVRE
ncbi:hypothetical protein [Butyrivibrio sp. WCD2001]|uniref:hypothetical protein n=1 Tax=Butyrivibrio sp. WCD2001 TaxID=1280681 RepID=UPI0012DBFDF8|nr:hypothetical protein [Butyrivibrio sp. WCD2001]